MYPSSNTQISHTDRLFAQKNCVQTLGITHTYLSERGILNINSFFKSKSVIEMQVASLSGKKIPSVLIPLKCSGTACVQIF